MTGATTATTSQEAEGRISVTKLLDVSIVAPTSWKATRDRGRSIFPFAIERGALHTAFMSARQILEELPHLTGAELREIERRSGELSAKRGAGLNAKRIAGRLVLTGDRVIRQAEVDTILDELP